MHEPARPSDENLGIAPGDQPSTNIRDDSGDAERAASVARGSGAGEWELLALATLSSGNGYAAGAKIFQEILAKTVPARGRDRKNATSSSAREGKALEPPHYKGSPSCSILQLGTAAWKCFKASRVTRVLRM